MGYQATIEKQGLWTIFDIKGDASAVAQNGYRQLGLSLPATANTIGNCKGWPASMLGWRRHHWLLLAHLAMKRAS